MMNMRWKTKIVGLSRSYQDIFILIYAVTNVSTNTVVIVIRISINKCINYGKAVVKVLQIYFTESQW